MRTLLALLLIACNTEPMVTQDASTDPPDTGSKPTCDLSMAADRTAVSEGSRLFLEITAEEGVLS